MMIKVASLVNLVVFLEVFSPLVNNLLMSNNCAKVAYQEKIQEYQNQGLYHQLTSQLQEENKLV